MYQIYEIRNKGTHRVEYLNIFKSDEETPDVAFKKNPDSINFLARPDIYIAVAEGSWESKEQAWSSCINLYVKYKLIPAEKSQEIIDNPRTAEPQVIQDANPGSETEPTPEAPKKPRARKSKD